MLAGPRPVAEFSGPTFAIRLLKEKVEFSSGRVGIHPSIPSLLQPFNEAPEVFGWKALDRSFDLFDGLHTLILAA